MDQFKIKQFRKEEFPGKDSRKQWAEKSGVSVRSIINYENGSRPIPKWYLVLIELWKNQK
jgi:DNA-binding XRE family transcriptional regulator